MRILAPARNRTANGRVFFVRRIGTKSLAVTAGSLVAFVIIWSIASTIIHDAVLLPGPAGVASRAAGLLWGGNESIWPDIQASTVRVLLGWSSGIAVGVPLGAILAVNPLIRSSIDPLIQGGRAIPPLAWAPLLIVWLGIGEMSKVFLLFIATVPIIAIATTSGILGVDQSYRRAAQTLGASNLYVMRRVVIPASLPEIITAMRITFGLAWSCLVAAELIASTEGIGYRILQAGRYLDTQLVFVGILIIGLLALIGDLLLRWLYRLAVPWKGRN